MEAAADAIKEAEKQLEVAAAQLEAAHIQILYSELTFNVQKDLHAVFHLALNECTTLGEEERNMHLAKTLKEHIEKTTSLGWSCIVGSSFSASFAFNGLMHHFMADPYTVLLFRSV